MKLSFTEYKNKVLGCWMGKNIGGVLGAPFEGKRQINHVDYYTEDLPAGLPANDDLDLQLVWLNAAERYGRSVNSSILGEYWLSFIIPDWVEYGAGKNNLRRGLVPPLSGHVENVYRESNGCFIRSEIWACLAPGHPELAARYAYEDSIVDHSGDGVYAAVFCAAVESAAFVVSDPLLLIDIGLSYIPEDCGVAKAVKIAIDAYNSGKTWQEARRAVLDEMPGTFGIQWLKLADIKEEQLPIGEPGYDAPCSIGLIVIAWLYSKGDFGEAVCIATNCGEDTDCTAATIGAILGIIGGFDSIPEKWIVPIGDAISVRFVNQSNGGLSIPNTVTELTNRILRLTPMFLGNRCDILNETGGYTIEVLPQEQLYCVNGDQYIPGVGGFSQSEPQFHKLIRSPYVVRHQFPVFNVALDYVDGPYIQPGIPKKLRLIISEGGRLNGTNAQWMNVKWYLPDGVAITPQGEQHFFLKVNYQFEQILEYEVTTDNCNGIIELIASLSVQGRHSHGLMKAMLIPGVKSLEDRDL